jgi:ligand-binding sensor domain-containing protein
MKLRQGITLLLCLCVLSGRPAWPEPVAAQVRRIYDPGNWLHYNTSNSDLLSNEIQAIAYTEDVNTDETIPGLWIGTDAGLNYINHRGWVDYTAADSVLPGNNVQIILSGHEPGELWIGTDAGAARLDYAGTPWDHRDDTWEIFTAADGLPGDEVLSLALGQAGQVWVGTAEGLACYDGATWRTYTDGLPGFEIRDLVYDAGRDVLWIATGDGAGMLDLGSETWTVHRARIIGSELPNDDVRALAVSEDGQVWMGTAGGLATLAPDGTWQTWVPGKPGLPRYAVTDLSLDPSGRYLWVATDGGGASRYDIPADHWDRFNTLGSDLPDDRVRVVLASHETNTWLGTAAGLSGMERMWETYSFLTPRAPGLLANDIWAGWVDPETGTVWVATGYGGVSRSDDDGASWQTFTTAHGLRHNQVFSVWGDGRRSELAELLHIQHAGKQLGRHSVGGWSRHGVGGKKV